MSDKTEAPTPRRKEEAREQGQIARSHELNASAALLASMLLLNGPGHLLLQAFQSLIVQSVVELPKSIMTDAGLKQILYQSLLQVLPGLGLFLVGLLLTGVIVTVAQTGLFWAGNKKGFDFNRINPLTGIKRIFSTRGLIELLKALLKLTIVIWVAYNDLNHNYQQLALLNQYDLGSSIKIFYDLATSLGVHIGTAYFFLAAADYVYQRWELMRGLRMTKQEIKEEYKRSEGDPFLKSRIRSQQRRMARSRMMSNVPKATVVVTNPTHLAVAIQYSKELNAPRLLAKGAHKTAERIRAIAREHSIPVVENVSLARAIYKTIEVDQEITPDLYVAMAEVLAYVYRIKGSASPVRPLAAQPEHG